MPIEAKIVQLVKFSELNKWDCKRYITSSIKSKFNLTKVGKHIICQIEKIKPFDVPDKYYGILGVSNTDGMFDAYIEKGSNIKQPYKIVKNGYIAYNPYRVNVGSVGLKTDKLKHNLISPAYVVFSCKETLLPEFIKLVMQTQSFNRLIRDNTTGSVRQTLSFDSLSEIKIPLPSIAEQRALLDKYNAGMKIANEAESQSKTLDDGIDSIILEYTNCTKSQKRAISSAILKVKAFSKMLNWGANLNANAISPKELFYSKQYRNVALSSIAEVNPTTNYPQQIINEKITFLPMECISDVYGDISEMRDGTVANAKGYTRFQENDILWAKITPCMQNGKCAIARNLESGYGYGSTEYHIIRANTEKVLPEYLYCFLRTQLIREVAQTYFSGSAGQQRVGADFLENLNIPLLPIRSDDKSQMTQETMVKQVFEVKAKIKALRKEAESLRQRAKKEFEEVVFGE